MKLNEFMGTNKLKIEIKPTKHGNYDFYIYVDDKPLAVSIDSYATKEDCENAAKLITQVKNSDTPKISITEQHIFIQEMCQIFRCKPSQVSNKIKKFNDAFNKFLNLDPVDNNEAKTSPN